MISLAIRTIILAVILTICNLSYSQDDLRIREEFIGLVRNEKMTESRIKPFDHLAGPCNKYQLGAGY